MARQVNIETMTGEEFKTFIEEHTSDGVVNTIPELMERVGEVPDDTTLADWIEGSVASAIAGDENFQNVVHEAMSDYALKKDAAAVGNAISDVTNIL